MDVHMHVDDRLPLCRLTLRIQRLRECRHNKARQDQQVAHRSSFLNNDALAPPPRCGSRETARGAA
jgi:hypothetical protein